MPDGVKVRVEGLRELEKAMFSLGPRVGAKILRSSLNAGLQVVRKDARNRVPKDTGRLRRAIYIKRLKPRPGQETYKLAIRFGRKEQPKNRDAFYWWWLEFGTQFINKIPFLRPAFESKKHEALGAIQRKAVERFNHFKQTL